MFQSDAYFGSASDITAFRNWFTGTDPTYSGNRKAVSLNRWAYDFNLVGNVLGVPDYGNSGFPGVYEISQNGYSYNQPTIYQLGFPSMGNNGYTGVTYLPADGTQVGALDENVETTLLRQGNFDYVTNSTIWDPSISNHSLPASLYLSVAPSWWNADGTVPWPPIGPDVSGKTNEIPAELRYNSILTGAIPSIAFPDISATSSSSTPPSISTPAGSEVAPGIS
jgi:hypothetical protein